MSERLSPVVRRYLAGVVLARLGTGMTLPFTVILLHEVRGVPLPTVGLLLALPGALGLAVVPLSGALVDRFGPRSVLACCLCLLAAGTALLAVATSVPVIAVALVVSGLGLGPSFPAGNALLAGLVEDPRQVQRAFGMQFTLLNAAIGVGSLLGALVADESRPGTFTGLYLASAVAVSLQVLLLPPVERPVHDLEASAPSYREVLADRTFLRMCVVTLAVRPDGVRRSRLRPARLRPRRGRGPRLDDRAGLHGEHRAHRGAAAAGDPVHRALAAHPGADGGRRLLGGVLGAARV